MGRTSPTLAAAPLQHWNPKGNWQKRLICQCVVQMSRGIMNVMNAVEFEGREHWESAFQQGGRGILSFSNHVSLFDDPLLVSSLGRTGFDEVRWIGADHLNFYGSAVKGFISSAGKCVPIIRGGGLDQPGLSFLADRLKLGEWVHIFPEGGRTRDPGSKMRHPFKTGIGQLLAAAKPIAIPFYHYGMHEILPIGRRFPKWGKKVRVMFGEHTLVTDDLLAAMTDPSDETDSALWQTLASWSYDQLRCLEQVVHPTG